MDLLAQVTVREGTDELVLVHVEIERCASAAMGERLAQYAMALQLRHKRPVLPIVLFLKGGQSGIRRKVHVRRFCKEELHRFTYWQLTLSSTPAESFLQRDEPLAWALAALMRGGDLGPVRHSVECLTRIVDSGKPLNPAQKYLLVNCVGTYVQLDRKQEEELMTTLAEQGRRDILEIYDSGITWADRKREQALARARAEGVEEGRRDLILHLLEKRFGELPDGVRRKVQSLGLGDLESLAERVLTAGSIDEIDLSG